MNEIVEDIFIADRYVSKHPKDYTLDDLICGVQIRTTSFTLNLFSYMFKYNYYQSLSVSSIPKDFEKFIGAKYFSHKYKEINIDSYPRSNLNLLKLVTDKGPVTFIIRIEESYYDEL